MKDVEAWRRVAQKYQEPALTTQTLYLLSIIRHVLSAKLLTSAKNIKRLTKTLYRHHAVIVHQ